MGGYSPDNVLAHFGVMGMKWGKRKGGVASKGPMPKPGTTHQSHDSANADVAKHKVKAHGTKSLSNKELQDLVNRMNLEQQYSKLNTEKKQAGKDFAVKILKDSGQEIAKSYVKQFAKQGIELAVKSALASVK